MQIFYNGALFWVWNESPLQFSEGQSAPILGVFDGPTYLTSPWSFGIY